MKRLTKILLDFLFYSGIAVFLVALVFVTILPLDNSFFLWPIFPIVVMLEGLLLFILTLSVSHKSYHLFFSMMFFIWGLIFILIILKIIPYRMLELWPFLGVTAGLCLFVTGLYNYRKLKFGYVITAMVLFGFGIWLSLFSLKIIKLSFKDVVITSVPILFVVLSILIVGFFLLQQKFKQFVIKDDDPDSFDDDSPVFFDNEDYTEE